jgi:hypothetical protein
VAQYPLSNYGGGGGGVAGGGGGGAADDAAAANAFVVADGDFSVLLRL